MLSTSAAAYQAVLESGLVSKLQKEVYRILADKGPMTQGEMWSENFPEYQRHVVTPRFAELKKMELIREVDRRKCRYSGVTVLVYEVTNNLPKQVSKPLTRNEIIEKQKEYIIYLEDKIKKLENERSNA